MCSSPLFSHEACSTSVGSLPFVQPLIPVLRAGLRLPLSFVVAQSSTNQCVECKMTARIVSIGLLSFPILFYTIRVQMLCGKAKKETNRHFSGTYRMKRNNFSAVNKVVQSSPVVKQPKRGLCSSLRQTHALSVLLDWGTLPHHVILQIFQYLPLIDRARASSVCRRWNEVFHIPDLWRKFEFELNQSATSYFKSTHPDLIQQIIKKHAAHLQYVSFKVQSSFR